jgi:4-hydroxybenzoate polyprenyltransferase
MKFWNKLKLSTTNFKEANRSRSFMKKYFSLVLFAHSVFALPFAIIGFVLALQHTNRQFSWIEFVLMIACMVFARNAAMAFNRYLDRNIDARNPRTATRDVPAGRISPGQALAFTILNSLFFVGCTFFINTLCFYLSPIALLVILGYSYTKRFTPLCHLVLGLGLALAPIGAYLVVAGEFALLPIWFSIAVLCWVSGFDIIYALQDEEFDRSQGLKSIPVLFGTQGAISVSRILHVISFIAILMPVFYREYGLFYGIGVFIYGGLLIYQHRIVHPTDLSNINRQFMTTNGYASVVFAFFYLLDAWLNISF